jgi:hypothetical protein
MDAFISYSNVDRDMAHATKEALREFGIAGFLAHEDLQVSEEWRNAIIEELKVVAIFVALLSENFSASEWCAQEVGYIISRAEVLIVPLSLDGTVPGGFISTLQSKRVRSLGDVAIILRDVLFKKRPRLMIPRWIERVRNAGTWRGAEALVEPLVPYFPTFTASETRTFMEAALGNNQVWDAGLIRTTILPAFAREHWRDIPRELRARFLATLELAEDDVYAV